MYIYIYIYHCTTEEGDRVLKYFGCVIIVIIKFVDQDIIEFLSCFIYIYIYIYIYYKLLFKHSSAIKIGVGRVNQASKLTRTEVNDIVDVAVNCVQIVEEIRSQSAHSKR